MHERMNSVCVICAALIAALLFAGCNRQPAPSGQPAQPSNEVKPIVGDTKNTSAEPLTPAAEEPVKTTADGKLSEDKEVVAGTEAPKVIKLKDNSVCYSYRK